MILNCILNLMVRTELSALRINPSWKFLRLIYFLGIMEFDGQWHISATERLKNLILNEYVVITVKSINEFIHAVTVDKNCENNTLNVADQLVIENLAKYSNSGHGKYFNYTKLRMCSLS